MGPEPPVYRPFALLGLAATLAAGIPLGVWLLAWLYLGLPRSRRVDPATRTCRSSASSGR
jgi:hypothetical protein